MIYIKLVYKNILEHCGEYKLKGNEVENVKCLKNKYLTSVSIYQKSQSQIVLELPNSTIFW
jgi:hypothetical protein